MLTTKQVPKLGKTSRLSEMPVAIVVSVDRCSVAYATSMLMSSQIERVRYRRLQYISVITAAMLSRRFQTHMPMHVVLLVIPAGFQANCTKFLGWLRVSKHRPRSHPILRRGGSQLRILQDLTPSYARSSVSKAKGCCLVFMVGSNRVFEDHRGRLCRLATSQGSDRSRQCHYVYLVVFRSRCVLWINAAVVAALHEGRLVPSAQVHHTDSNACGGRWRWQSSLRALIELPTQCCCPQRRLRRGQESQMLPI
ncbi:hypothetical protein CC86DRAFT_79603 [Ophiobolus disseminans]|uniref:Uncharacterized protein n=1 Tax=Ophiobolus disseminans TaxID=1469910 RepID=A0A6A6ZQH5_9PLEO|nr:hypothetical protein CC86DRAFT_79603 [Ophiobolus disseminans]